MALSSRAFAAFLQAPPALTRDLSVERDVAVTAPDGTRLLTDLYLAGPREPLPTVLIRSPYGRRGMRWTPRHRPPASPTGTATTPRTPRPRSAGRR